METDPSVAICIITYKRPSALKNLLASLRALSFSTFNPKIKLVVVDNSTEQEAEPVVRNEQMKNPWEIIYEVEPHKGLCFARNHAVRLAADADLVAFIDDDEVVQHGWLEELLISMYKYQADVVRGPVISICKEEPPMWIKRGNYHQRPIYEDGRILMNASTNNVLVKNLWLNKVDPPFDIRLNLSGGEDSYLFRKLNQEGAKIVWSENAVVEEILPDSRLTAKWILRRSFRLGNTSAFVDKLIKIGFYSLMKKIIKNLAKIILGIPVLPFSLIAGKVFIMKVLRRIYYGFGYVLGFLGYRYLAYK